MTLAAQFPWRLSQSQMDEVRRDFLSHLQRSAGYAGSYPMLDRGKPAAGAAVEVIAAIDKPKSGTHQEMYFCAFCQHDNKFWSGYLVNCDDGKVRLIGNECAAGHIGANVWQAATAQYVEEQRRIRKDRLIKFFIPSLDRASEHAVFLSNSMKIIVKTRAKFIESAPELFSALRAMQIENKGMLVTYHKTKDIKAMMKAPDTKSDIIYRSDERHLGNLRGGNFIILDPPIRPLIDCVEKIGDARRILLRPDLDALSASQFNKLFLSVQHACRSFIETAEDARHYVAAYETFRATGNLAMICRWANDRANGWNRDRKFRGENDHVYVYSDESDSITLVFQALGKSPSNTQSIEHLKALLSDIEV
jgi:hypothetical protein